LAGNLAMTTISAIAAFPFSSHPIFAIINSMATPRVSIVMSTYNRARFIEGAIKSAQAQNLTDWELLISDDSPGDDTAEVIKKFAGDARIRYVHRTTKGTIANSSNAALARAHGTYVAILDDDDWWIEPKKLEKQVAFLDTHPEYIGCGGGFAIVNENGEERSKVLKPETDEAIRRVALYANPLANSTTMFRRAEAGTYDEKMRQFADWDFWLKLGTKGKLYNFPEYFLAYRMWEHGASFTDQRQNVDYAIMIVRRYKDDYPGFLKALCMAYVYWYYARLPLFIRKELNSSLSRLKKAIFSR